MLGLTRKHNLYSFERRVSLCIKRATVAFLGVSLVHILSIKDKTRKCNSLANEHTYTHVNLNYVVYYESFVHIVCIVYI